MYTGVAKQVVHALKFERLNSVAVPIANSLAPCCPAGIIVPVPTATKRVRQRGYDQAALIARQLARITGNSYSELLKRTGSQRQLGQMRIIRERQLDSAFRLSQHLPAIDTPIVLIDDVFTTGSTFETAAGIFKQSGFVNIHACAFAWANVRLANR